MASGTPNNPGLDITVRRTRGLVTLSSDQQAVVEDQEAIFGMGIVSTDAVAAGVASIPGPLSDPEWGGWFVWIPLLHGFCTSANEVQFPMIIDSKAQRIIDGVNETLVVVGETGANSEGVRINFLLRVLTMLRGTG